MLQLLTIDGIAGMPGPDKSPWQELDPLVIGLIFAAISLFILLIALIAIAYKQNKETKNTINLKRENLSEEEISMINAVRTSKNTLPNPFLKFTDLTEEERIILFEYRKNHISIESEQCKLNRTNITIGIFCFISLIALIGIIIFLVVTYA